MKMLILKDSRVLVKAGEIVEVSPAQAGFLMSTHSAVPAGSRPAYENPEFERPFETPEDGAEIETVESIPEVKKTRNTRKK